MSMSAPVPVAQNQVPMITELSEQLGYDSMTDRQALHSSAHQWRRSYKCRDGTLGKDLTEWKSASTLGKLRIMTEDWLEHKENGKNFWRKGTFARSTTALEWPIDSRRITMLMQQLFWRQNVNEARNAKNPARQHSVGDRSVSSSDGSPIVFAKPWNTKASARKTSQFPQRKGVQNSLTSASKSPHATSNPTSRWISSIEKPQSKAKSDAQTIEDIMKDGAQPKSTTGEKPVKDTGKTDVYDFPGTDGDDDVQIIQGPTPTSPAPVARMFSGTVAPRDPNFAFDAVPSAEPKKTEKPQNQVKTPKKRKRARRIGSRVGSEDDDETYTPSKAKQKRTTSPKSATSTVDSGSSKRSEKDNPSRPNNDKEPPSEGISLRRESLTRRKQSGFSSDSLMERFKASRHLLEPPHNPNSSQDPLASAAPSQTTVDIAQQYPDMVEHMHTFPAEPQIATMSPNKVPNSANPSTLSPAVQDVLRKWALADEYYKEQSRLRTQQSANHTAPVAAPRDGSVVAQPAEQSIESIMTSEKVTDTNAEQQPSRPTNVAENTRIEYRQPAKSPTPLFIPTTDSAQNAFVRMSSSDQTPTEHEWNRIRPALNAEPQAVIASPRLVEQASHENATSRPEIQAEQPDVERHPQPAPSLPTPTSDAAPAIAPKQITIPKPTPAPAAALTHPHPPTPKPTLQVRYWIVESRVPEFSTVRWIGGGLLNKSLQTLCDEISLLIGRPVLRSITVNLRTAERSVRSEIHCDKPETFTELQEDFAEVIKQYKKKGNTMFEITLEPDPSARMVVSIGGGAEDKGEDSDVEF